MARTALSLSSVTKTGKRKRGGRDGGSGGRNDNPLAAARRRNQHRNSHLLNDGVSVDTNVNDTTNSEIGKKIKKYNGTVVYSQDRKGGGGGGGGNSGSGKAEQIWHRRTGGGLRLFVEYYLGQPYGVCTSADQQYKRNEAAEISSEKTVLVVQQTGMSRAAKKRRRKQQKNQTSNDKGSRQDDLANGRASTTASTPASAKKNLSESMSKSSTMQKCSPSSSLLYDGQLLEILSKYVEKNKNNNNNMSLIDPDDLHPFLLSISTSLPITFRLRLANVNNNEQLLREAQTQLTTDPNISKYVRPITSCIYQSVGGLSKVDLAKGSATHLKQFLLRNSQNGVLARQEFGSMLPVWLLSQIIASQTNETSRNGSSAWTRILDMCSSPGSKLLQAVEYVLVARSSSTKFKIRANDVNLKRLDALKDAVERSGMFQRQEGSGVESTSMDDSQNKIIHYSNIDATKYPIPKKESKKYSIILADVPCSGDGTTRKDVPLLRNWFPHIGNRLHPTQLSILVRALKLLALNGLVAYSTCSLNAVENEAVVAAALRHVNGNAEREKDSPRFKLVSLNTPSIRERGIVLRPGVEKWRVADMRRSSNVNNQNESHSDDNTGHSDDEENDKEDETSNLEWFSCYEDAVKGGMVDATETLWPDFETTAHDLKNCVRLWPQDQDTGGFFVAIIRRVK